MPLYPKLLAAVVGGFASAFAMASGLEAQLGPGPGGRAPYASHAGPRNEAGRFDYYSLVLSWSPTYCAGLQRDGYDPQCHARDGKRYAFVLHGLWPQHESGWPESCPTRDRPFVAQKTIDGMLDIMPSPKLVIHEYRKHGTCSGLSPEEYYKVSRQLFQKVRIPPRYERPSQALTVSPAEVVRDFVSVNPEMKPESIAVACGGPGNRLREVRICFSREGMLRSCGSNEDARRLCRAQRLYVPPVRGGAEPRAPGSERQIGPPGERRI
ncbi:MAG: ribonuclease T2 [Hyphomicrobiaceae bacterium]|nr:ribonuclease T2 [Hyphomicrobiaceae bacterium]